MQDNKLAFEQALAALPACDTRAIHAEYLNALKARNRKVVVLDDDPTGVQTVHDVYVYTDWDADSILQGFEAKEPMFFVLTNSRGFSEEETAREHRKIAANVVAAAQKTGQDFILVSRGDSTLRGHYPLETLTLKDEIEKDAGCRFDGEVIMPFFMEGGRYTLGDTHYVLMGDELVPAGQTEFAQDKTFGYKSSDLREWVEEKTKGAYKADEVVSITIDELRGARYAGITRKLMDVSGFGKVIVNAASYADVEVFTTALIAALNVGKRFLYRTAAAFTKVIGGVDDKPLLTREELVNTDNKNGGLIIVGSHVKKTTVQLETLKKADFVKFIEFNQHLVTDARAFGQEQARVIAEAERCITGGQTVAVYTRRERFDLGTGNSEDELRLALKISRALTGIVESLRVRPNFIIAKGGITSSDIGTHGLGNKKALVMGQILKGIPVWLTGQESRFPGMPYVIFPGNVGDENALYDAVVKMQPNI